MPNLSLSLHHDLVVLLDERGNVKICDLGLAAFTDRQSIFAGGVGTLEYMPVLDDALNVHINAKRFTFYRVLSAGSARH